MVTTVAERFGRGRFVAVSRPERPHRHVGGMVGGSASAPGPSENEF